MEVKWFEECPKEFLSARPEELYDLYGGPFVIDLKGKKTEPLVVSVLLHGNERTGLFAIQNVLRKFEQEELPRSLIILVGNTKAAKYNQRYLEDQLDYNRIWNHGDSNFHVWASEITKRMVERKPFASIDIHNNTGKNPYYGCINKLDPRHIKLASLFKSKIVYFTKPDEVFSISLADYCPSTTIECGLSGEERGVIEATDYVLKALRLEKLESTNFDPTLVDIYHTTGKIKIGREDTFCFGDYDDESDFCFPANFEYFNFSPMASRSVLGHRYNKDSKLMFIDNEDKDSSDKYIAYEDGKIVLAKDVIPSMFTKNKEVIYQDCLGYLMERIDWEKEYRG